MHNVIAQRPCRTPRLGVMAGCIRNTDRQAIASASRWMPPQVFNVKAVPKPLFKSPSGKEAKPAAAGPKVCLRVLPRQRWPVLLAGNASKPPCSAGRERQQAALLMASVFCPPAEAQGRHFGQNQEAAGAAGEAQEGAAGPARRLAGWRRVALGVPSRAWWQLRDDERLLCAGVSGWRHGWWMGHGRQLRR